VINILILIFLNIASTLAYNVSVESEGSLKDCVTDKSEEIFLCKNNEGENFLIKKKNWEYIAMKKSSSGAYLPLEVYDISDENDDYIYSASLNRYEQEEKDRYQGPLNDYINNERYLYNDFFKKSDDKEVSSGNTKINSFVRESRLDLERKKKRIDESINAKKFKIKLKDGQEIKCNRSEKVSCPLLNCEKDAQGIERKVINPQSPFFIYLESFGFKNNQFMVPENSMISLLDSKGNELIKYAKEDSSVFKQEMLVPSKYKNNPRLFNDLKEPSFKSSLSNHLKGCGKSTLKKFLDIQEKTQQDLIEASMLQYIDIANGILQSNYINEESIPGSSCYHNGAYYAPPAYKRALETAVMSKKTISMDRAQELLDMAAFRKDIPWNYTLDGCYARAHIMARSFEAEGVHVDKAWLRGSLRIPGQPEGMNWGYHVAPLVYVEKENGEIQEMIIDPSISQEPLTPKEWADTMNVNFDETEQVSFPTPTNTSFYKKTSYSVTNTEPYWPDYNYRMTEYDKERNAEQTMFEYGGAPQSESQWEQWDY